MSLRAVPIYRDDEAIYGFRIFRSSLTYPAIIYFTLLTPTVQLQIRKTPYFSVQHRPPRKPKLWHLKLFFALNITSLTPAVWLKSGILGNML